MTSISSPNSLASFSTPHASSSKRPHIALNPVYNSETSLAVAAAQGDGVWTYDLSTLRPTSSFTVPPSTVFTTSPISYIPLQPSSSKGKQKSRANDVNSMDIDSESEDQYSRDRITVVAVGSGEKIKDSERGKVLWVWRGDDGEKRATIKLKSAIHSLRYVSSYRTPILVIFMDGSLAVLDHQLEVRPVETTQKSIRGEVMFAEVLKTEREVISVGMIMSNGQTQLLKLDTTGGGSIKAEIAKQSSLIGDSGKGILRFAELDTEGNVTAITDQGELISRSILDNTPTGFLWSSLKEHKSTPILLPIPYKAAQIALIPVYKTTLILASLNPSLPAVLSTLDLSTFTPTQTAKISNLSIISQVDNIFTIAAVLTHSGEEGGRSVIYTLEVTVPLMGVGMSMLLGTKRITEKYLTIRNASNSDHLPNGTLEKEGDICELLERDLSKGSVEKAEKTFKKWLDTHKGEAESDVPTKLDEKTVKRIVQTVFTAALGGPAPSATTNLGDVVDPDVAMDQSEKKQGPYASGTIHQLITMRLVKDDMWDGGVVAAGLLPLQDWSNVAIAIKNIPSLSSKSMILILKAVLARSQSTSDDALSISKTLSDILSLPPPAPDYKSALLLLSAEESTTILSQYVEWLQIHVDSLSSSLSTWSTSQPDSKLSSNPVPALQSLIIHVNLLLDAQLPSLLSHPASWPLLEKAQESLEPLLGVQESYRKLRAPVEAVLTLARREAKKAEERRVKKETYKIMGQSRKGKGKAGDGKRVNVNESGGGLPDEAVGKWRVEDLVF